MEDKGGGRREVKNIRSHGPLCPPLYSIPFHSTICTSRYPARTDEVPYRPHLLPARSGASRALLDFLESDPAPDYDLRV